MSKKLNEEYERFVSQSTPDLWSRIEEALPEKKKKTVWQKYRKIMPAAAAVLVLAVCIPLGYGTGLFGMGISKDSTSLADSAVQNSLHAEGAAEYEMADEAAPQAMPEEAGESWDTSGTVSNFQQEEAEKEEVCIQADEVQKEEEVIEEGSMENFPVPEINRTVWSDGKLLSAEVKIEMKDHSTSDEKFLENTQKWYPRNKTCYFELPVLLEDTKAVKKINQDLYKQYEEGLKEYQEWIEDEYVDEWWGDSCFCWDTFLSYNDGGMINFGVYEEAWCGGTVSRSIWSYTYDLNTGDRLNLADVLGVAEDELKEMLLKGFQQSAREEPDDILWETYTPEALCERLADYEVDDFKFCIQSEGEVDIWFAKYELLSGADGMQVVTIGKVNYGQ